MPAPAAHTHRSFHCRKVLIHLVCFAYDVVGMYLGALTGLCQRDDAKAEKALSVLPKYL
jgi:hypothetical protein